MSSRWKIAGVVGLGACVLASATWAEVFVYPKPGQTQDQFQFDQFQCHEWAKQQTGFDPAKPQMAAVPEAQTGGAIRGAAGGAALGAIGGAIAGDAGKGAAIGAGVGAGAGLLRQGARNRESADAARQAQGQQQASVQRYEGAYATCLRGRGYQTS
jgi:Glycine-zipper domain